LREVKGLTQDELGELCGIKQSTISKIEAGRWNFSIDFLTVILQKLDSYLFFLEKDSKDELAVAMRERWKKAHQEN
jgi:transcriptional regulator with XRE-family HTH domain